MSKILVNIGLVMACVINYKNNAFGNVAWKMVAILFRDQGVNYDIIGLHIPISHFLMISIWEQIK